MAGRKLLSLARRKGIIVPNEEHTKVDSKMSLEEAASTFSKFKAAHPQHSIASVAEADVVDAVDVERNPSVALMAVCPQNMFDL